MKGLREARERKGVSQKRAAADLGIDAQGYRNYEYGRREPSLSLLVQMAKYYNCTVDELVGYDKKEDIILRY